MVPLGRASALAVAIVLSACLLPAAAAPTVDLSTSGSSGFINGAYFEQVDPSATGSGTIHSFVRIQTNDPTERGYNTDYRPLEFNENNSGTFTRSLSLGMVPIVNIGGVDYREFLLDINENTGQPGEALLSLDTIEIYLGTAADLTGYPTFSGLATVIFDLDAGAADNWVLLNYDLNGGSGAGDMLAYIPDALFVGGDYVYLYSEFGGTEAHVNSAGYEEWAVRLADDVPPPPPPPPPPVPVPGALLLALLGGSLTISLHRRRTL